MMVYRKVFLVGLFFFVLITDQVIKKVVLENLSLYEQFDIFPFFSLQLTINTGIAFSIFSGANQLILIFLSLGVMGIILFWGRRVTSLFLLIAVALILGGAAGNLIDRIFYGYVIDYFLFHTPSWSFAVFNLADAFITMGAFLIILNEFLQRKSIK